MKKYHKVVDVIYELTISSIGMNALNQNYYCISYQLSIFVMLKRQNNGSSYRR